MNANSVRYWAHSDRDGLPEDDPAAHWQPLAEHLANVGVLARKLALLAAPDDTRFQEMAECAGFLHDFGKYTDCFQNRIRTGKGRCPHAIHGAATAVKEGISIPVGLAIAGHHAGIPDLKGGEASLLDRVRKATGDACALVGLALHDTPALARVQGTWPKQDKNERDIDLSTRMLFSCLVDADRLDSSGRPAQQRSLDAAARLDRLLAHIHGLPAVGSEKVRSARRKVLDDCLAAAAWPERILSLSVPTGGGKTLAAMAFALRRAALKPESYRRVIVVIPYLSIIEQNAEVYEQVFGPDGILEHHSGAFNKLREQAEHFFPVNQPEEDYKNPLWRAETENWDAPLIVTTSVRFFESLFSNSPGDLRRVHNIARSIVILDEVQVLPPGLLAPLLSMIGELESKWGCTFVLSTATQPAFEKPASAGLKDPRWEQGRVREIVQAPAELHRDLRRVIIDWRIEAPVDWPDVASWMRRERQALCVVNLKEHAQKLYEELAARTGGSPDSEVFHLSTRMCAAHRLRQIHAIRDRLRAGRPCLVVSTQLIEAGVDLDFPVVFRALGPLDSIVQVAGRADREGILTERNGSPAGRLTVFKPIDRRLPPNEYEKATGITEVAAKASAIEVDDLGAMSKFFSRMYGEGADLGGKYLGYRSEGRFAKLADEFEMISSRTQDVFVPFEKGKGLIQKLKQIKVLTRDLRRDLQRYTIGLYPWEFRAARGTVLAEIRSDTNLWYAVDTAYDENLGLLLSLGSEKFIW